MKKTMLLAAIAVMTILLATACGEISDYKKAVKALDSYENALKSAKTCADIQTADKTFEKAVKDINEEAMSEDEIEKLRKKTYGVLGIAMERSFTLCADEFGVELDAISDDMKSNFEGADDEINSVLDNFSGDE